MKSYNSSTRKIQKLWGNTEAIETQIISRSKDRILAHDIISLSQPITSALVAPLDISSDWLLMTNDTTLLGNPRRLIINFQIIFERIDVRMIPFFRTQLLYRVGNDEENEKYIDDPLFHPTGQTRLINSDADTRELIQEIDLINEDNENMKRVIYNKSLVLEQAIPDSLPDFQVKLNAKFTNPHIYY